MLSSVRLVCLFHKPINLAMPTEHSDGGGTFIYFYFLFILKPLNATFPHNLGSPRPLGLPDDTGFIAFIFQV